LSALLHYTSLASYEYRQKGPLLSVEVDTYLTLPVSLKAISKCLQSGPHRNSTNSILSINKMTSTNSNSSNTLSFNNSNNKLTPLINNNNNETANENCQNAILSSTNHEQENNNIKNTSLDKIDKKLFNDSHSVSSTPNLTSSSASSSSSSPPTFSTKSNQSLPVSPLLLNKTVSHTQPENSSDVTTPVNTPVNAYAPALPLPSQPLFVNRFIIKKVPDNELHVNASSNIQNALLAQNLTKVNETSDLLERENNSQSVAEKIVSADLFKTEDILKAALVNDTSVKERKISKFTVLKVDANSLYNNASNNVNLNNSENSKNDSSIVLPSQPLNKTANQVKEVKFAVDIDSNQSKNENTSNINSNLPEDSLSIDSSKDLSKQQQQNSIAATNYQHQNISQTKSKHSLTLRNYYWTF
jgi:hypothetical protein